jgi:ABC-type sugar transport system substrate-binding protein
MQSSFPGVSRGGAGRLCAYVFVMSAVIGCERPPAATGNVARPSQGRLIVLIGPAESSPQREGIWGGARRVLRKYPSLRLETVPLRDDSGAALSRAVRDALSDEPSAVCLYVSDPAAAHPAASEVVASGTILVTMGTPCGVAGTYGHVQVDLAAGAELLGDHLEEIAGGKQSYVLLHRHGASPVDTRCYERFMRKARSRHGISLLEEQNIAESQQPASALLRAMFARFRYAGLAVTLDPTPWLRSPPAELLGRNARFATLGAVPALWPYLRSGEAAALAGPLDGEIGSLAVELALIGITESGKTGMVRTVQAELVTPGTLDDFARRYAEAADLDLNEFLPATTASQPATPPEPVLAP